MPDRASPYHVPPARARRILDQRTAMLAARRGTAPEQALLPTLICRLDEEFCGVPLPGVARVVPDAPCAALPGAPAALLGLVGLRGQSFLLLDLALAMGRARPVRPGGHLVVLRHAAARLVLRVDRAEGVRALQPLPPAAGSLSGAISGHALLPTGPTSSTLVGLIDMDHLLQRFLPVAHTAGA